MDNKLTISSTESVEQLVRRVLHVVLTANPHDVGTIGVVRDAVHLAHVHRIGHGRHVHFDVFLSRPVRLPHRVTLVYVGVSVAYDDGNVSHAVAVTAPGREDAVVGPVDRLLRVGLASDRAEAQRVQDLLLALVRVEVELDLGIDN